MLEEVLNKMNKMNYEEAKEYLRNLPEKERYVYRRYIENAEDKNFIKPIF